MRAFQSLIRPRVLNALAVLGIGGAVLLSYLPQSASAQPRPPVELGDPTDVDYGPAPKKSAAIRLGYEGYESIGVGGRFGATRYDGSRREWWLSGILSVLWRYSALR